MDAESPQPTESQLIDTMRLLDATRRELDEAEDVVKQIQDRRRELEAAVLEQSRALGLAALPKVAGIGTFVLAKRVFYSGDKDVIRAHLKEAGREEMLTCNAQTFSAYCKELLESTTVLPDGTEVTGLLPDWVKVAETDDVRWLAHKN